MGCTGFKRCNKLKTQCIFTQGDDDAIKFTSDLGEMTIMRMQLHPLNDATMQPASKQGDGSPPWMECDDIDVTPSKITL